MPATAPTPSDTTGPSASASPSRLRPRTRRTLIFSGIAIVIVVVVVVAAVQVYRAHGSSTGGSTVVLIPGQSETPISAEQLAAVDFSLSGPGSLNGTYSTVRAVTFYIMTPAEYEYFALKNALDGYTWIYNASADTEKAYLEIQVQTAGEWVFAMYNANATTATAVGWITPLTLTT